MKLLTLLIMMALISCGDSPFLNDDDKASSNDGARSDLQDSVELDVAVGRTGQGNQEQDFQKFEIKGHWQVGPNTLGNNKFIFFITNLAGDRVELPYEFKIFLWMPNMGHGSAPVKITKIDKGIYEVSKINFIMTGEWDIHFQFKRSIELAAEILWPISL